MLSFNIIIFAKVSELHEIGNESRRLIVNFLT